MVEKNEKKVSLGIVICMFIIFILIIVLFVVYYLGFVKNEDKNAVTENQSISTQNTSNQIDILGSYIYEVPGKIEEEIGNYYDGIEIEFLNNNKFKFNYGEGYTVFGTYIIENDNLICTATLIKGEFSDEQKIDIKYVFEIINKEIITITSKEGNRKIKNIDGTEKDVSQVFEEIGSKFIKK